MILCTNEKRDGLKECQCRSCKDKNSIIGKRFSNFFTMNYNMKQFPSRPIIVRGNKTNSVYYVNLFSINNWYVYLYDLHKCTLFY